jgi:flavodoxin
MARALVVFESMFGNTATIARAVADGLGGGVDVDLVEVGVAPTVIPDDVSLLVLGGPTHAFGMSRPGTRRSAAQQAEHGVVSRGIGLREWIAALDLQPSQISAATFDTMLAGPRWIRSLPSAGRDARRRLVKLGVVLVARPETFYVADTTGPLVEGEEERARKWGERLVAEVRRPSAAT